MALRSGLTALARRLPSGQADSTASAFLSVPNSVWISCFRYLSTTAKQRLLVVHSREKPEAHLQEALRLAETFTGASCPHEVVGPAKRLHVSSSTYFGSGTVSELAQRIAALDIDKIFFNVELTGVQQRNLQAALGRPVIDRMNIIIDIFGQRARTREAKLQVEMAALELRASRLVRARDAATGQRAGFGEQGASAVVSARERGRSGSGTGGLGGGAGAGESELQLQRSRLRARIRALKSQLADVRKSRAVQRSARNRSSTPTIAVVGYTNAGKSSLVSHLARCDISVQDRLFETLDTTTRRVNLPSGRQAVFTDTVGFISDLPTQLIDAFRATLEEVTEADLLLHVLDASSPAVEQQRLAVLDVLRYLGFSQLDLRDRVVEVWNKADLLNLPVHVGNASSWSQPALAGLMEATAGEMSSEEDGPAAEEHDQAAALGSSAEQMQRGVRDGLQLAEARNRSAIVSTPSQAAQDEGARQRPAEYQSFPAQHRDASSSAEQIDGLAEAVAQRYEPAALSAAEREASAQASKSTVPSPQASDDATAFASQSDSGGQDWSAEHDEGADALDDAAEPADVQQLVATRSREEVEGWLARRLASRAACPHMATTSVKTGYGLQSLLLEVDRKVAVKYATREVHEGLARMGPGVLIQNLVGPAHSRAMLRHMSKGTIHGRPMKSPAHDRRALLHTH